MKIHRKKEAPSRTPATPSVRQGQGPDRSFYVQHAGEPPLDSCIVNEIRQNRRTSRHSSSRQVVRNNRASNWSLFLLLCRALLILVLIGGGFFLLRTVLNRIVEPSETEKKSWEANESRMLDAGLLQQETEAASAEISPQFLLQKMDRWDLAGRRLRAAESLSRRGIPDEAAARLAETLSVAPFNSEALRRLSDLYLQTGRHAEAIPLLIRLLDQNDRDSEVKLNLLKALDATGQTEPSLVLAERMLLEEPNNLTLLSIAAAGAAARGNQDAALALFERVVALNAADLPALQGCAKIHFEREKWDQAIPYYLELVRLDPRPDRYYLLARCFAQQNEAGKSVLLMGQASSLFGSSEIKPWLVDPAFDPVRETPEFRSFADWVVGIETRKAIEEITLRKTQEAKASEEVPSGLDLPKQPELQVIRPGR